MDEETGSSSTAHTTALRRFCAFPSWVRSDDRLLPHSSAVTFVCLTQPQQLPSQTPIQRCFANRFGWSTNISRICAAGLA